MTKIVIESLVVNLQERLTALRELNEHWSEVEAVGLRLKHTIADGGTLYIVGNGGSLSQAEHFAGEVYRHRVVALTNPASITAIANDYDYNSIFSSQLSLKLQEKDIVILLSTSGESDNIQLVAEENLLGSFVIVTGNPHEDVGWSEYEGDNEVLLLGNYSVPVVQEMTLIVLHRWADIINDT